MIKLNLYASHTKLEALQPCVPYLNYRIRLLSPDDKEAL